MPSFVVFIFACWAFISGYAIGDVWRQTSRKALPQTEDEYDDG